MIGPGRCDEETAALAGQVGAGLAGAGFTLVTGGAFGAMEAAARGASEAGGTVVGLLPGTDRSEGNQWSDVTIATGLGHARNLSVVASADVVVAVGGELIGTVESSRATSVLHPGAVYLHLGRPSEVEALELARADSTVPISSPPTASTIATESGDAERSAISAAG